MKTRAAVAWKAGAAADHRDHRHRRPASAGEVLVEIMATGVCHTDAYTLSGADPEGIFPAILGHEGAGIVREVGAGVTTLKPGDHVIPLYTPECRQCKTCLSQRSNLCTAIRATQGKGVMPDGTSRFSCEGAARRRGREHRVPLHGLLHLRELHRAARDRARQRPRRRALRQDLLHRLRRDHRHRRRHQHREGLAGRQCRGVRPGRHRAQRAAGARAWWARTSIIGIDINPAREAMARKFGMTALHQPGRRRPRQGGAGHHGPHRRRGGFLLRMHRQRATSCARRWNAPIAAGARASSSASRPRARRSARGPSSWSPGASWRGTAFGGARGRTDVPTHRRLVHGWENRDRQPDHPHHAAR